MKREKCNSGVKKLEYSYKDLTSGVAPEGVYRADHGIFRVVLFKRVDIVSLLFVGQTIVEPLDPGGWGRSWWGRTIFTLTNEKFCCSFEEK